MTYTADLYAELSLLLREAATLRSCSHVLSWDEQTYMPAGGAEHRANQLGMLAGLTHERATSPRIGELLQILEQVKDLGEADDDGPANVREARRAYLRATCLPRRLVEELSRLTTLAQQAWVEARKASDFDRFAPFLTQMIALKREEAAAVGYGAGVPYDALLDDYEPQTTSCEIAAVFTPLRTKLVGLLDRIRGAAHQPDASVVTRHFPRETQQEFAALAARAIGFDFGRGRIDTTAHPFCSGIGPGDCRLTTRYDEHHFNSAFFGVLHEAGHGIYEQGLRVDQFGLPLGQAVSLGIHESQSRMWENLVGRSMAFWRHFYPLAQQRFSATLGQVSLAEFHAALNEVRPSFIRVEADEVTYNLHIMLRFELEQQLIAGELAVADVPEAWNAMFTSSFGMTPENAAQGCLQDIHWSAGLLGYFPTYALGNMYASQFFEAAQRELGDLDAQFARGEFQPLKEWLSTRIHQHGQRYSAGRLVQIVTGQPLSDEPLLRHLESRFSEVYRL